MRLPKVPYNFLLFLIIVPLFFVACSSAPQEDAIEGVPTELVEIVTTLEHLNSITPTATIAPPPTEVPYLGEYLLPQVDSADSQCEQTFGAVLPQSNEGRIPSRVESVSAGNFFTMQLEEDGPNIAFMITDEEPSWLYIFEEARFEESCVAISLVGLDEAPMGLSMFYFREVLFAIQWEGDSYGIYQMVNFNN